MESTTSDRPRFVVDASVAVKWHLNDEEDVATARKVRNDFVEGRILLLAPEQIRYEVPSAIRNAVRSRRLTPSDGATAVTDFLEWQLQVASHDTMILAAYDLALRFGCSLYDALYLALAESSGCPLVYADNRLRNSLGGRFPLALWIGDYQFLG